MQGLMCIFFCALNNFSLFYECHEPQVSEFNIGGFFSDQHSLQRFKPGFGVRLKSFPFFAHMCCPRSRNLVSWVEKVLNSVEWVSRSCLHAQHGRVPSTSSSASPVTDLGKPLGCLIIAESYVGDYGSELSKACAPAPTRAVHARSSLGSPLPHSEPWSRSQASFQLSRACCVWKRIPWILFLAAFGK